MSDEGDDYMLEMVRNGGAMVAHFCWVAGCDLMVNGKGEVVSDLLTDLRHWCRVNNVGWEQVLREAMKQYEEDVR